MIDMSSIRRSFKPITDKPVPVTTYPVIVRKSSRIPRNRWRRCRKCRRRYFNTLNILMHHCWY